MKLVIDENQRGFLFRNGTFQRMLEPGKYYIWKLWNEGGLITDIYGSAQIKEVDINVLLRDKKFAESVAKIDVPDNHFAIRFEDGRVTEALKPGTHYYWNIYHKQTFELVDISCPRSVLPKEKMSLLPSGLFTKIEVPEGQRGLLFYDGKFQEQLESGSHYFWNGAIKVSCQLIDLRVQQLDVNSQEILTADKVSLRLNFVCTYKITDAVGIYNSLKDYKEQIYVTTQLALREYVGSLKFDELLEQKDSVAAFVLEKLKKKQKSLYIEFIDSGLKDVILPGEIRDIMNTVLIAEKNAQANVISRREEVASTRSLLNTAKLMEENSTLFKLKELEYLERICDKVGNISVGGGSLLEQLRELLKGR